MNRKPPNKPVRKITQRTRNLYDSTPVKQLLTDLGAEGVIDLDSVRIESELDSGEYGWGEEAQFGCSCISRIVVIYTVVETDEKFAARLVNYKKRLKKYNTWRKANK